MNTLGLILALAAATSASIIPHHAAYPASVAVRAPAHDSAIIQSHRLGGNFAYRTDEAHAYAVQTPVLGQRTIPVGVSYHKGTPIVKTSTDYVKHLVPQTGIATYQAPAQVVSRPIVAQQAVHGAYAAPASYAQGAYASPATYDQAAYAPAAYAQGAYAPAVYAQGAYAPATYAQAAYAPTKYANAAVSAVHGAAGYAHAYPSAGVYAHGIPSAGVYAHGLPATSAYTQGAHAAGGYAHAIPSAGVYAHGIPARGVYAHGSTGYPVGSKA